jgi:hypothetical protein
MREANDRGFDCLLLEDSTESYFATFKQARLEMIRARGHHCSRRSMPDPARVLLPGLLAGGWRGLPFVPFRAGIEIHRIYGDGIVGPAAAVLRYRPGAGVPWHEHRGSEHVVVLEGSQEDERGSYPERSRSTRRARAIACAAAAVASRC